jgi:hypothetical protein
MYFFESLLDSETVLLDEPTSGMVSDTNRLKKFDIECALQISKFISFNSVFFNLGSFFKKVHMECHSPV